MPDQAINKLVGRICPCGGLRHALLSWGPSCDRWYGDLEIG